MTDVAYRVPFVVERHGSVVSISNVGAETVPWMRVDLDGGGVMTPLAPGRLGVGEVVSVRVAGGVERRGRLRITWMRAGGDGPFVWLSGL